MQHTQQILQQTQQAKSVHMYDDELHNNAYSSNALIDLATVDSTLDLTHHPSVLIVRNLLSSSSLTPLTCSLYSTLSLLSSTAPLTFLHVLSLALDTVTDPPHSHPMQLQFIIPLIHQAMTRCMEEEETNNQHTQQDTKHTTQQHNNTNRTHIIHTIITRMQQVYDKPAGRGMHLLSEQNKRLLDELRLEFLFESV